MKVYNFNLFNFILELNTKNKELKNKNIKHK